MGYCSNDIPGISSLVLTRSWGCFKITTVTSVLFCLLHNLNILLIKYFLSMTVFSYSNRKKKKKKGSKTFDKGEIGGMATSTPFPPPFIFFPEKTFEVHFTFSKLTVKKWRFKDQNPQASSHTSPFHPGNPILSSPAVTWIITDDYFLPMPTQRHFSKPVPELKAPLQTPIPPPSCEFY